jgi:hypothetical protein
LFPFQNEGITKFVGGGNNGVLMTTVFIESFNIPNFQLTSIFPLVATLCEGGGTPKMVATLEDPIVSTVVHQHIPKAN